MIFQFSTKIAALLGLVILTAVIATLRTLEKPLPIEEVSTKKSHPNRFQKREEQKEDRVSFTKNVAIAGVSLDLAQQREEMRLLDHHDIAPQEDVISVLEIALQNGADEIQIELLQLEEERGYLLSDLRENGKKELRAALQNSNSQLSKINREIVRIQSAN